MTSGIGEARIPTLIPEVQIKVDYGVGRWSRTYHIFDIDGREIALHEKDACQLAKKILAIAKRKE